MLSTGVGIEVEVERVPDMFVPYPGWEKKRDGSLREGGVEFVTDFGSILEDIPELLDGLFDVMVKQHAIKNYFSFSERTSIHVHIDVRKLSPEELKSLLILYTIFEDSFFKIAGEGRKHNVFCVPLRYVNVGELTDNRHFSDVVMLWRKYSAMNLCRIADFGTVEFRHMEGNMNKKRILDWVFLLAKMVDYCRVTPFENIKKDILELKYASQYEQFTEKVFGLFSPLITIVPHDIDMAISDSKLFFSIRT